MKMKNRPAIVSKITKMGHTAVGTRKKINPTRDNEQDNKDEIPHLVPGKIEIPPAIMSKNTKMRYTAFGTKKDENPTSDNEQDNKDEIRRNWYQDK